MSTRKIISIFMMIALSLVSCRNSDSVDPLNPTGTTNGTGGTGGNGGSGGSGGSGGTGGTGTGKFKKNVLIEDYTGTWCQYCPRVIYAIEQVEAQNIDAVTVAIHRYNSADPFNFAQGDVLENFIGLTGYPDARLNRKTEWNYPEAANINQVKNLTGNDGTLGLALKSTVQSGNIDLDVKVKFGADMSNVKLVVYVLEDGLVHNQTNTTSYYGGQNPIANMTHNHVLRASLTNLLGDAITGTTTTGSTFTKNFSVAVPSNVSNASKMSFVAFVVDSSGKAINVRKSVPGVDQNFQEL